MPDSVTDKLGRCSQVCANPDQFVSDPDLLPKANYTGASNKFSL